MQPAKGAKSLRVLTLHTCEEAGCRDCSLSLAVIISCNHSQDGLKLCDDTWRAESRIALEYPRYHINGNR